MQFKIFINEIIDANIDDNSFPDLDLLFNKLCNRTLS